MFSVKVGKKLFIHISRQEMTKGFSNELYFNMLMSDIEYMSFISTCEDIEIVLHERGTKLC